MPEIKSLTVGENTVTFADPVARESVENLQQTVNNLPIPKNTSQLNNDSGYVTDKQVNTPTLSVEKKRQIQALIKKYVDNRSAFMFYGDTIMNAYANYNCWNDEKSKFKMCCNTFVEQVWMGRDPEDFIGKNKESYSNKVTKYFDWGYKPEFEKRSAIGGAAYRLADGITLKTFKTESDNLTPVLDENGEKIPLNPYIFYKQPRIKADTSEDPNAVYVNSYSASTTYDPDSNLPYKQWFNSFQTQGQLAYELWRKGYGISPEELDVGDLVFNTRPGAISDERSEFLKDMQWHECTHVSIVYHKDEKGNLYLAECSDVQGSNKPIYITSTAYSYAWDKCRTENILSNVVFCARHPAAWGHSNMEDIEQIDYQLMAYPDGYAANNPIPVNLNSDGTMADTVIVKNRCYIYNNKIARALVDATVSEYTTDYFTRLY